jgi:hypothetical protein
MQTREPVRVVADGREAPALLVTFQCPRCFTTVVADAYRGPLTCHGTVLKRHPARFMTPVLLP